MLLVICFSTISHILPPKPISEIKRIFEILLLRTIESLSKEQLKLKACDKANENAFSNCTLGKVKRFST